MTFEDENWRLVHVVHYDCDGVDDRSSLVAHAIASAHGVDPTELQPPLSTVINLEAIDDLFESPGGTTVRVDFRYGAYMVRIRSDDRIQVHERVPNEGPRPE